MFFQQKTINCGGRLLSLEKACVMGILNVTPDSFFDGGNYLSLTAQLTQAEQMIREGATIIDVGGMSSRPGAAILDETEERQRVIPVIEAISTRFPEVILSVDTVRAGIARAAIESGAHIVNDISAGRIDPDMYRTVASLGVPYILMHMQGTPGDMQKNPQYENVSLEILDFFIREVGILRDWGVKDILLDPGFGFGKTVDQNYRLLSEMHVFHMLEIPLLAGISRKSMINRVLGIPAAEALNGTTALHMIALQQGARILRVHDVREAVECIRLWDKLAENTVSHQIYPPGV